MPKPILLVEDDRVYAMMAKHALKRLLVPNELVHAANGKEALEYLHDWGNPRPCLILLDLYMPMMNGVEFLRVVKNDKALRHIPVVILTASNADSDVATCFELGASEYLIKSVGLYDLLHKFRMLMPYWTGIEVGQQHIEIAGSEMIAEKPKLETVLACSNRRIGLPSSQPLH